MSAVHADNCCTCGHCPINGTLVGEYIFTNLNALDASGNPTQFVGPITYLGANLSGHFVLAYAGEGAWTATQSGTTRWFTMWDFLIQIGTTYFAPWNAWNRVIPEGQGPTPVNAPNNNGHLQVGPPIDPTFTFGTITCDGCFYNGIGYLLDWLACYNQSGGVWPVDNSSSQAEAEGKCLAVEVCFVNDVVHFGYSRSTAYTVVMAGTKPPKFRLYKILPQFSIFGCALIYGGSLDPHMHLLGFFKNNDRAWVYWIDLSVVGNETDIQQQVLRTTSTFSHTFSWPNTAPTAAFPASAHLQVLDSFSQEVVADGTFTIAVILTAVSVELLQQNAPGNWQVELDFRNVGNAQIISGSITLTAAGMTSVTISQGSPFAIGPAFPPPFSNSPFDLNSVIFTAQFANVNNTVTATITEGPRTFNVLFTVNGTT